MTLKEKTIKLRKIASEIERCKICKRGKIGKAVPGEGNANAKIVFVGEAPGKTEAATGRPFVGRSGKFLREQIRAIGLKEKGVFITSPVKYLPKKGTPNPDDIAHGRVHVEKQLNIIKPELIVLLGRVAAQGTIGEKISILRSHGKIIRRDNRNYFLTIHPAAAIRFQNLRAIFKKDFKKLMQLIKSL